MTKVWKINSKRKDPNSRMRCKVCGGKPTRWYKLMSTTVYRCEKHKTEIASPVYDQGKISSRGELIGMETNPTFEVGISLVTEYLEKSGIKFDKNKLYAEIGRCKDDHPFIERDDPDYEKKVKELVDVHLRSKHPLLFLSTTYYDEKGEHSLYLEHPEEFYLTQMSKQEVTEHFSRAIPDDLVGMDVTAEDMRR